MKNYKTMEGESKNLENNPDRQPSDLEYDARSVFQSVRIRRRSILADSDDWQYMGREFRFVLRCGAILWAFYLLSMAI